MDTSDPDIRFGVDGVCSHCIKFESITRLDWFPGPEGRQRLQALVDQMRFASRGADFDCALRVPGGVDSSYVALKLRELGLRVLCVHVDAGWNSELAVSNIERVVRYCGFELHTHVIDWSEMRDLQRAYFRCGVANQDVPQDHAFFASLYAFAIRYGIRHIVSGGNVATEGIFPASWHGSAMDAVNLRAIHSQFGEKPLRTYPIVPFWKLYLWYPWVRRMRVVRPLNFMPYDKGTAIQELAATCGYRPYPRKHGESIFTKLFQNHILPVKFGMDKRRPHLSSLIASGQIGRSQAIVELAKPLYEPAELVEDIRYFCSKLEIDQHEFENFMSAPARHYTEFRNWDARYGAMKRAQHLVEKLVGRRIRVFS